MALSPNDDIWTADKIHLLIDRVQTRGSEFLYCKAFPSRAEQSNRSSTKIAGDLNPCPKLMVNYRDMNNNRVNILGKTH